MDKLLRPRLDRVEQAHEVAAGIIGLALEHGIPNTYYAGEVALQRDYVVPRVAVGLVGLRMEGTINDILAAQGMATRYTKGQGFHVVPLDKKEYLR